MELATSTIIMVLVGLIVLAIIVVIFRQQATKGSEGYSQYANQTSAGALKNCDNLILGRKCFDSACPAGSRQASGFFDDCTGSKVCCESS